MYEVQKKKVDLNLPKGVICECIWCGDRFGSANGTCASYCKECRTAEGRKKIKEANEKILGRKL